MLVAAAVLLCAAPASAEGSLRASAQGALLLEDPLAGGLMGGVHLAYNPELEPLLLMPELIGQLGGYFGRYGGLTARALGGVRIGVAGPVEPAALVRVGWGWQRAGRTGSSLGQHGVVVQAGLGVDYRPERWLTLGPELVYDVELFGAQRGVSALHSLRLGAAVAFWF